MSHSTFRPAWSKYSKSPFAKGPVDGKARMPRDAQWYQLDDGTMTVQIAYSDVPNYFWEYHDLVYEMPDSYPSSVDRLYVDAGCYRPHPDDDPTYVKQRKVLMEACWFTTEPEENEYGEVSP